MRSAGRSIITGTMRALSKLFLETRHVFDAIMDDREARVGPAAPSNHNAAESLS
jgi:hypothetical protein